MRTILRSLLALGLVTVCLAGCCTSRAPAGNRAPATTEHSASSAQSPAAKSAPSKDTGGSAPRSEARQPAEVLPAQMQLTVYEVTTNAERAGELDARKLAASGSADEVAKILNGMGAARTLYIVDQLVNVYSETINIGAREAVITDARVTQSGDKINSFRYEDTGIVVRLSAQMPSKGIVRKSPNITLSMELSVLTPGAVEISPGRRSSTIRRLSLDHQEKLLFGQPRLLLLTSSTSAGQPSPASLYAVRYVFNPPTQ